MLQKSILNKEGNRMTKIYSTNLEVGGSGKTTITFNGGFFLAEMMGKKVCLLDTDPTLALTNLMMNIISQTYGGDLKELLKTIEEHPDQYTVKAIFEGGNPTPIKITDNIDFIPGYAKLYDMTGEVTKKYNRKAMYLWLLKNREQLNKYDYILIDTHNDESIFTQNALLIADEIIAVAGVDKIIYTKIDKLINQVEEFKTVELVATESGEIVSLVKANVRVVGNKFSRASNGKKAFTTEFEEKMNEKPDLFIGYFEERKFLETAKLSGEPMTRLAKKKHGQSKSDKEFFKRTWEIYKKIYKLN